MSSNARFDQNHPKSLYPACRWFFQSCMAFSVDEVVGVAFQSRSLFVLYVPSSTQKPYKREPLCSQGKMIYVVNYVKYLTHSLASRK